MHRKILIRTMLANDIPTVLEIQARCYDDTKLESEHSFLAKLEASPASCFIALAGECAIGYLVAVPAEAGNPPPLHSRTYSTPPEPNALYLHDLAVHPAARGAGVAVALIEAYFSSLRQQDLAFACLTAVNGASAFWERYGFRATMPDGTSDASMATYGEGAQYMSVRLGELSAKRVRLDWNFVTS